MIKLSQGSKHLLKPYQGEEQLGAISCLSAIFLFCVMSRTAKLRRKSPESLDDLSFQNWIVFCSALLNGME